MGFISFSVCFELKYCGLKWMFLIALIVPFNIVTSNECIAGNGKIPERNDTSDTKVLYKGSVSLRYSDYQIFWVSGIQMVELVTWLSENQAFCHEFGLFLVFRSWFEYRHNNVQNLKLSATWQLWTIWILG